VPSANKGQRVLVVGGHSRNTGKTSLVVDIIHAFPDAAWTAVKITQYGQDVCSVSGDECDRAPADHSFVLDEEHSRDNRTDSSRFLVAGAAHSYWLRTQQDQLAVALPALHAVLSAAQNVIIESNTLLRYLTPVLYLVVLDAAQADFKVSARQFLDRADAFVLRHPLLALDAVWPDVAPSLILRKPQFLQPLGQPLPPQLIQFVAGRLWAEAR
jgi:molybdopterin-guanine dinucleotide biosynthesis protein